MSRSEHIARCFGEWLLRRRAAVIIVAVALTALAAGGMARLGFTTDFRMFFSEENPELAVFERLQKIYAKTDNVLIVLAPADKDVFTPNTLALVQDLTRSLWQLPHARRVDSITNFQHVMATADTLTVADLMEQLPNASPQTLAKIRGATLHEPLLVKRLISPQGDVTGVNVTFQLPDSEKEHAVLKIAAQVNALAAQWRARHPEVPIYLTGGVMMDNAFAEATERDLKTLMPAMLAVLCIALGLMLRTVLGVLLTLAVLVLAVVGALGLAGWLDITLSPTSASAPTIILTVVVADCVHMLANFYQRVRAGLTRNRAVVDSLGDNLYSMLLTAVTTAVGFLTLNAAGVPVFRDLGNITAFGVAIAFVLSVTLLPAALSYLPIPARAGTTRAGERWEHIATWLVHARRPLFWTMAVVSAIVAAFIPRNDLNDEFIKYFGSSMEFRRSTDFAAAHLTGVYAIDYTVAPRTGEEGIAAPAYLQALERFSAWYREQPETVHVYALTDIYKRLNRAMHGDDAAQYRLPAERALAAQYLLLYEMSLPYGLDLNDRVSVDKNATRVTVTLKNLSSKEVLALENRANRWLAEHAPDLKAEGGGLTLMFAHIGQRNIESMLVGVVSGVFVMALVLIVAVRSITIGLISLIPNLLPVALAFGLWGMTVGQVGMAAAVVAAMSLGIVVDDTVHFLSHYLRARRDRGLAAHAAVSHAIAAVGPASIVTGIILMLGFAVLALSSFEINRAMGLLTAIAIGCATLVEFTLMPYLLLCTEKKT